MLIYPVALALGCVLGLATGGSLRRVAALDLSWPWLPIVAFGAQIVAGTDALHGWSTTSRFAVVATSDILVGGWILLNARRRPVGMRSAILAVAVGWALNLAAILANGGMPVSRSALRAIGVDRGFSITHGHLSKHVVATGGTVFRFLGDVIPLRPLSSVVSIGDLVMLVGIVATLVLAAHGSGLRPIARPAAEIVDRVAPPPDRSAVTAAEPGTASWYAPVDLGGRL